jgi:predicted RNase H-like nuclease
MVVLFGLNKTLKYKRKLRGKANDRHTAYSEYQNYLASLNNLTQPRLIIPAEILSQDTRAIRGKALKQYEDLLDAVMCAYIAFYYWWWGAEKCRVFGNLAEGHIITPFFDNK